MIGRDLFAYASWWQVALIFLIAIAARMAFFLMFTSYGTNAWLYVDSLQYHTIASHIVAGDGICLKVGDPQYYRLPGYPLFLAAIYTLFGVHPQVALIVQIIIASMIPCLVGALCLAVFPGRPKLALAAAGVAALHPGFILYSSMLATESLTVVLLLIFFLFAFPALDSIMSLLSAGFVLGLVSLIRPIGHYVLALTLLIFLIRKHRFKKTIQDFGVLSSGWLVVVAPWLIRNALLTGYLFFHSLPGLHFLQYGAVPVLMMQDNISYQDARAHVLSEWHSAIAQRETATQRTLSEYEHCLIGEEVAKRYIFLHPCLMLKHCVTEIIKTCVGLYSAVVLLGDGAVWPNYSGPVSWWAKIYRFLMPQVQRPFLRWFIYADIIMTALIFFGAALFVLQSFYHGMLVWTVVHVYPFIALIIALSCVYGGARLRMPIEPLMLICALYAWISLFTKRTT